MRVVVGASGHFHVRPQSSSSSRASSSHVTGKIGQRDRRRRAKKDGGSYAPPVVNNVHNVSTLPAPFANRTNAVGQRMPASKAKLARKKTFTRTTTLMEDSWKNGIPNVKAINLRSGKRTTIKKECEGSVCVVDFWISRTGANSSVSMDA